MGPERYFVEVSLTEIGLIQEALVRHQRLLGHITTNSEKYILYTNLISYIHKTIDQIEQVAALPPPEHIAGEYAAEPGF